MQILEGIARDETAILEKKDPPGPVAITIFIEAGEFLPRLHGFGKEAPIAFLRGRVGIAGLHVRTKIGLAAVAVEYNIADAAA